jgi:nitrite reductase (NO-forming) / hydroxylamine reductase
VHPKFGPVWATGHLGDETISLIGTDPEAQAHAFKVVRQAHRPGRRCAVHQDPSEEQATCTSDTPLNPDPKISQSVAVFDINNLDKGYKCCRSPSGRA